MDDTYIKIPAIRSKLRQAEQQSCILYIHALGGYGKTRAVQYYFRNKEVLFLSGRTGALDAMPPVEEICQSVIVIDDISFLRDTASMEYLAELVQAAQQQIVLLGRCPVPTWLKTEDCPRRLSVATEPDLMLDAAQTKRLLANYEVTVTDEEAVDIAQETDGHAVTIKILANRMSGGKPYDAEAKERTRLDLYRYCDHAFYDSWDSELRRNMLRLAVFDRFTMGLAEMVTGSADISRLFEKAMTLSEFLMNDGQGNYHMRPILLDYLRWKQQREFTPEQYHEIYRSAGLYHELQGEIERALDCYSKAESQSKIADLLVKNARKHPGNGHYFETRSYYLALPEEQVCSSPILMSGVSMLHSLLLQVEESERWYAALRDFAGRDDISRGEKQEAKTRLAYLDIALPHRGSLKLSEILKTTATLCMSRSITLPEFSVTSNLPSVMNGGKDFCRWSKNDRELARTLQKPVELVLGPTGVGLVNIALAESAFEKNTMDTYEIMTMLNGAYTAADAKGTPELCFAATGIMARVHLSRGQPQIALSLLTDFQEKAKREQVRQLLPNVSAMLVWLDLLSGSTGQAKNWLQHNAPNENLEFYILDRYRYLMKVRVYLAFGQYEAAVNLIERLSFYFEEYERTYQSIECGLLRAIVQYRMNLGHWQKSLKAALHRAQEYGFIRVVQQEGVALKPLLEAAEDLELDPAYWGKIICAVDEMARFYPEYLKRNSPLQEPLTATEEQILHLLCRDVSMAEIAKLCGISYNTVKYHNKNLYRKLSVSSRQEAQAAAKRLGLEANL